MSIRDKSQNAKTLLSELGLEPLYALLDNLANDISEDDVSYCLNLWLSAHSKPRHTRWEFSKGDTVKAWKRQHGVCPYCHTALVDPRKNHHVEPAEQTTCDHLTPCADGGTAEQEPVACHRRCNSKKGTHDLTRVSKQTGLTTLELLQRMNFEGMPGSE